MGNWGGPRGLAFADSGERFAAIGEGGVVATWRLGGSAARPADGDGALCADWWHHVRYNIYIYRDSLLEMFIEIVF